MNDCSGNIKFEDFERFIWKLAHRFYDRVPDCFRGVVDVEDLYSVGAAQFYYALSMYQKRRGKKKPFSTLLAYSVTHKLSDEIRSMTTKMRLGLHTAIDNDEEFVVLPVLPEENPLAEKRVQRFYELASDDLRSVLDDYIFSGKPLDRRSLVSFERYSSEVRWLSAHTGATVEDFLSVIG